MFDNTMSDILPVQSGVPQVASDLTLGPLLFILYVMTYKTLSTIHTKLFASPLDHNELQEDLLGISSGVEL